MVALDDNPIRTAVYAIQQKINDSATVWTSVGQITDMDDRRRPAVGPRIGRN